jgi:sucrose phosphorylase
MASPVRGWFLHISKSLESKIAGHLIALYGAEVAESTLPGLFETLCDFAKRNPSLSSEPASQALTQRDAILITYGDQFQEPQVPPLQTLRKVLTQTLDHPVSGVHILPFSPYSSDDGFSVIDYTQVNPAFGTWLDVERLGGEFRLMFDLVINHVSRESEWFQRFLAGDPAYADWFITVEPGTDLSSVFRPRALPLLTEVQTRAGERLVWTTFSADQIDLNFAHPAVLLKMLEILLLYVEKGARIIRLDAIAYLWKKIGTSSIHLEETHRVIKLMRAVLDAVAPGVFLITETNVPHEENISYFGEVDPETGRTDEAQLVYQFPLAPLVMHSLLSGDASALTSWAAELEGPAAGASFFNFTASHDGIGVMPARGLLSETEIRALVEATVAHGGRVSYKTNQDGSRSVYELNISYFDALSDPSAREPLALQVARFAASQAIMLALAGVPGVYVHSLLGSRSWREGVARTGHNRTINRQKFDRFDLEQELRDPTSLRNQVYAAYTRLLSARGSSAAFHPHGDQQLLPLSSGVFALLRTSPDRKSRVVCLHNVSQVTQPIKLFLKDLDLPAGPWHDLISARVVTTGEEHLSLTLKPYQILWLGVFPPDGGQRKT